MPMPPRPNTRVSRQGPISGLAGWSATCCKLSAASTTADSRKDSAISSPARSDSTSARSSSVLQCSSRKTRRCSRGSSTASRNRRSASCVIGRSPNGNSGGLLHRDPYEDLQGGIGPGGVCQHHRQQGVDDGKHLIQPIGGEFSLLKEITGRDTADYAMGVKGKKNRTALRQPLALLMTLETP